MDLLEKLRQKRTEVEDLKAKIDDIKVRINKLEGQIVFIKELIEEDGGEEVEEFKAEMEAPIEEDECGEEAEEEVEDVPEDYESPFEGAEEVSIDAKPLEETISFVEAEPQEETKTEEPEQLNLEL